MLYGTCMQQQVSQSQQRKRPQRGRQVRISGIVVQMSRSSPEVELEVLRPRAGVKRANQKTNRLASGHL
jgi:starvation-inducible outer membrane lipoprotein